MKVNPAFSVFLAIFYTANIHAQPLLLHCEPDSHQTILFTHSNGSRIDFSPLDPAAIWVNNDEINVQTGKRRDIIPGKIWHESRYEWYKDAFDTEYLWLALPYEGIFRMHKATRQLSKINISATSLTAFLAVKDGAWLAKGYELYFWDRKSDQVSQEKNYPVNIIIRHLGIAGDTLLVNDYYKYAPGECKLEAIETQYADVQGPDVVFRMEKDSFSLRAVQHFSYPETQFFIRTPNGQEFCFGKEFGFGRGMVDVQGKSVWSWNYDQDLKCLNTETGIIKRIPLGGMPRYRLVQANNDCLWLYGKDELTCFNPTKQQFLHFPDTFSGNLLDLRCDNRNVYLCFPDRFTVVNIAWLLRYAHDAADDWRSEEAFWAAARSLHPDSLPDFYTALEKYRFVKKQFGTSNSRSIQERIRQSANFFEEIFLKTPDTRYPRILDDLQQGKIEPEIVPSVLHGLMEYTGQKGQVQECIALADQYTTLTGNEPEWMDFSPIRTAAAKLDSLASADIPVDARLYAEGQVYYHYCHETPWFTDFSTCCVNTSLANERFRRLLRDYPESEWADNAAFDTLPMRSEFCPGCDPFRYSDFPVPPEVFDAYQQVARDYPQGDARPQVLYRLAWLYAFQAENYNENALPNIQSGLKCIEELTGRYPAYETGYVQTITNHLHKSTWKHTWSVGVRSERSVIKSNDSLHLLVYFHNETGTPRALDTFLLRLPTDLMLNVNFQSPSECRYQLVGTTTAQWSLLHDISEQKPALPGVPYQMTLDVQPPSQQSSTWQVGLYRIALEVRHEKRDQCPWYSLGTVEFKVTDGK
ncbi:MAG TPA: hypothetical protein PK228_08835 [Saprospiraceae bacterium]|nr:hypothetical protein [Saprospiraceae bacterium]